MKVEHGYDSLSNKEYTIEFSKYIGEVMKNVTENWESCVEQLSELVLKKVETSRAEKDLNDILKGLFASGDVQRITGMPKDKYNFESLYAWQQLHTDVLLQPLYADVIERVREQQ